MDVYSSRDKNVLRALIATDPSAIYHIALAGDYRTQDFLYKEYRQQYESIYSIALISLLIGDDNYGAADYLLKYIHPFHNYDKDRDFLDDDEIRDLLLEFQSYQYDATRSYYDYMYDTNTSFRELADDILY